MITIEKTKLNELSEAADVQLIQDEECCVLICRLAIEPLTIDCDLTEILQAEKKLTDELRIAFDDLNYNPSRFPIVDEVITEITGDEYALYGYVNFYLDDRRPPTEFFNQQFNQLLDLVAKAVF